MQRKENKREQEEEVTRGRDDKRQMLGKRGKGQEREEAKGGGE